MQQYKKIKEESEVESSRTSLASKVKSLTSKPPSPRKYPVLGRGQHYFLICWKSAKVMNIFSLTKISRKICDFLREDLFFFLENTCALYRWPWAFLSSASRRSVLGKSVIGLGLGFFFVSLASSLVSSTPPLGGSTSTSKLRLSCLLLQRYNFTA